MGNFLSCADGNHGNAHAGASESSAMIAKLEERLARLEKLDSNQDGVISNQEFADWKAQQERDLHSFREQIIKQEAAEHQRVLIQKDTELKALQGELNSLKALLTRQEHEALDDKERLLAALASATSNTSSNAAASRGGEDQQVAGTATPGLSIDALSEEQIRRFVEELLTDDKVNIGYLPDWVERRLYMNFFNLLIGLLRKTVSTTSFELLGHEVKMVMLPNKLTQSRGAVALRSLEAERAGCESECEDDFERDCESDFESAGADEADTNEMDMD